MITEKNIITSAAIACALCLGGCSLFHQHHEPRTPPPMKNTFVGQPAGTAEPRFDSVSPTTDY